VLGVLGVVRLRAPHPHEPASHGAWVHGVALCLVDLSDRLWIYPDFDAFVDNFETSLLGFQV